MDFEITRAEEADLEEILQLQKLAYLQEAKIYNDFTIAPLHQTLQEIQADAKNNIILKAVLEGRIVGSVRAFEKQGTCYIGRVIVHPDCQNRGIGKKLMRAIEEHFPGCRYELFTGYLSEKNLAFYEMQGYRRFDIRKVNDKLQFVYLEKRPENPYKKFALYYDAYVGGFKEDIPVYMHFVKEGLKVLEAGCGTGRVLKPLLEVGCTVTGVDISSKMLSIAENNLNEYIKAGRLSLINHNLCEGPIAESFHRAFVTFYTFNYLIELPERERFIHNIFSLLEPGGVIVLDLFRPMTMKNPELEDKWTEKSFMKDGRRIVLQDKRRMDCDIEERMQRYINKDSVDEVVTRRSFFTKRHVQELLSGAGFRNVRFADGYEIEGLHQLNDGETETGSFIVTAEK